MKGLLLFEVIAWGVLLSVLAHHFRPGKRGGVRWLALGMIGGGVLLGKTWITVPPANVAALYDPFRGGIQPYDLGEGWHLVAPWATVKYFSVRTQAYTMSSLKQEDAADKEDTMSSQTSEGLALNIDATVLFHISAGDANRLWKMIGPNYIGVVVRPNVREAVRIIVSSYPIMSVYSNAPTTTVGDTGIDFFPGKRQEVADRISERVSGKLKDKGVTLERFLLRNVDYMNPEFERAILDKQIAQQRIVTQQYEAQIQRVRAQANIVRAEGDAEAIRLTGNALRVQPKVVQWEMVEKLPKDLEVMIVPDRAMPLLDLREAPAAPAQTQGTPPGP